MKTINRMPWEVEIISIMINDTFVIIPKGMKGSLFAVNRILCEREICYKLERCF